MYVMDFSKQYVRILLVGDESVGKTSIVIALATEEPPLLVPSKAHDLYITGEVTNQSLPALIVDTCSNEQSNEEIVEDVIKSDVICLVYSLGQMETRNSVVSYWLPLIEKSSLGEYKPVVIIGNKSDLVDLAADDDNDVDMFYIREEHPQVEGFFRVSAVDLSNLVEVFQFAQKTVLQPIHPLVNPKTREVSPLFEKALKRIFKIFDSDCDGVITWQEMLEFQKIVFKNLLYRQTLQELREAIARNISGGLTSEGFTFPGFLYIHKLFIVRGMRDSIWKVLTTFGYNIKLELDENYLLPYFCIKPGEYVELNLSGIDFFRNIFKLYDRDGDDGLTCKDLCDLFVDFPQFPLSDIDLQYCEKNKNGHLSLNGFLTLFVRFTHLSLDTTLTALAILGYSKGLWYTNLNALQTVTQPSRNYAHLRTNFVCSVFGNYDSGKSSFIGSLFKHACQAYHSMNSCTTINIDSLKKNTFITVEEVPWFRAEKFIIERFFDFAIFVFDSSEPYSFNFCREIHNGFTTQTPCLFVGMKKDRGLVDQISDVEIKEYCSANSDFPLYYFSTNEDSQQLFKNLYNQILSYILYGSFNMNRKIFKITIGVLALAIAIATLIPITLKKIRR